MNPGLLFCLARVANAICRAIWDLVVVRFEEKLCVWKVKYAFRWENYIGEGPEGNCLVF